MKTDYSKPSVKNMVAARHYIVGSILENGTLSFSNHPVSHNYKEVALEEARRLAVKTPGKAYVVAQFVGGCVVPEMSSF